MTGKLNIEDLGYTKSQIEVIGKIFEGSARVSSPGFVPSFLGTLASGKQTTLKQLLSPTSGDDETA